MNKIFKIAIVIFVFIGVVVISIAIDEKIIRERDRVYNNIKSNSNPFYNQLTAFGLINVYSISHDNDNRRVHLHKRINNKEDLLKLKELFLEAEKFYGSLAECLSYRILKIFDETKENYYLTDMWLCGEFNSEYTIVFREEGEIPGEVRENATGLRFSEEESGIIRNIIYDEYTFIESFS